MDSTSWQPGETEVNSGKHVQTVKRSFKLTDRWLRMEELDNNKSKTNIYF